MSGKQVNTLLLAALLLIVLASPAWAASRGVSIPGSGYIGAEGETEVPQVDPTPSPSPEPEVSPTPTPRPTPGKSGGSSPKTGDDASLTGHTISLLVSIIALLALVLGRWQIEDMRKRNNRQRP